MNKNIKYLIEDYIAFNPAIKALYTYNPETKEDLIKIIK